MTGRTTFNFPTPIRFGVGVIDELADHLLSKNLHHPLIVTDGLVKELDFFKGIILALKSKGLGVEVFSEMHKNPVESDVLAGGEAFREAGCDCIVGLGGGVPLDVARARK